MAAREGVDLQQQDQAHDAVVERRADAAAMGQHQAGLQLGHLVGGDRLPRQAAEAGVDAVDAAPFGDDLGHGAGRALQRAVAGGIERDPAWTLPEVLQILQGQPTGFQNKGVFGQGALPNQVVYTTWFPV